MSRHPNRKQLQSWLDGNNQELDEHIDKCLKCANTLDSIDPSTHADLGNVEPISEELRPALMALLQPPEDLHARIYDRVRERLQTGDDLDLFGSLLGIPFEMGGIILDQSGPTD